MTWTPEETEFAKKMATEGHGGGEIAMAMSNQFERKFSRNTVVGKLHRLRAAGELDSLNAPILPKQGAGFYPADGEDPDAIRPAELKSERAPSKVAKTPHKVERTFLADGCQWVVEPIDGETQFCGDPLYRNSYCERHSKQSAPPPSSQSQKRAWQSAGSEARRQAARRRFLTGVRSS